MAGEPKSPETTDQASAERPGKISGSPVVDRISGNVPSDLTEAPNRPWHVPGRSDEQPPLPVSRPRQCVRIARIVERIARAVFVFDPCNIEADLFQHHSGNCRFRERTRPEAAAAAGNQQFCFWVAPGQIDKSEEALRGTCQDRLLAGFGCFIVRAAAKQASVPAWPPPITMIW